MDEPLIEPEVRRSVNGVLSTSLRCAYTYRDIGGTRLYLRAYESGLGPTLRMKPGETLKIRLINDLPPNRDILPSNPSHPPTSPGRMSMVGRRWPLIVRKRVEVSGKSVPKSSTGLGPFLLIGTSLLRPFIEIVPGLFIGEPVLERVSFWNNVPLAANFRQLT